MRQKTRDVIIIGCGVIGAAIAYYLSRRGVRVIVLEAGDIASGSSGACDGHIFLQSKQPGLHLDLALAGRRCFDQLDSELEADIGYRNTGGLVVIQNEEERQVMRRRVENQSRSGLTISLVDTATARGLEPCLSRDIRGAVVSPLDAQVNPIALTLALAQEARKHGARIETGARVVAIETRNRRVSAVRTATERLSGEIIVNAAGAHAAVIGEMAGIRIPVIPRRGQLLVTEPQSRFLNHSLLSAGYLAAKFHTGSPAGATPGISVEQTASGNVLIGSTREFVGFDRRTTFDGILGIARGAVRMIPRLRNTAVIRSFSGLRPFTPDGLPILGPVTGLEGFIIAAGHEGDGISLAPITGQLITALISREKPAFPLNALGLERFGQGSEKSRQHQ